MSKKLGQVHKNQDYLFKLLEKHEDELLTIEVVQEIRHIIENNEKIQNDDDLIHMLGNKLNSLFIHHVADGSLSKLTIVKIAKELEKLEELIEEIYTRYDE